MANRLVSLELPIIDDEANTFCCGTNGGCYKYDDCDIHPQHLKNIPIAQIEANHPKEYKDLKKSRCLRTLIHEKTIDPAKPHTLGDFIGARPDKQTSDPNFPNTSAPIDTCAYHGCVVPESANSSNSDRPFEDVCPFGSERTRDGSKRNNLRRYTACKLTRRQMRSLQQALKIATISPVAIVPSRSQGNEVIYMGKNPNARFQFIGIDPDKLNRKNRHPGRLPQENARQHAARLVRQYQINNELDSWQQKTAKKTVESLSNLQSPDQLSELEKTITGRYIPAGEFVFLCVAWFLTGEPPTPTKLRAEDPIWNSEQFHKEVRGRNEKNFLVSKLDTIRDVCIENRNVDLDNDETCLLHKIVQLGFEEELGEIFGRFDNRPAEKMHDILLGNEEEISRRSTRLDDFLRLGIVSRKVRSQKLALTKRAKVLTEWLSAAYKAAIGEPLPELSPCNPMRCRELLLFSKRIETDWVEELGKLIADLESHIKAHSVFGWLQTFTHLADGIAGNGFENIKLDKPQYRDMLRNKGFPTYPLVHLTLLTGFNAPLDWTALAIGGMSRTDHPLNEESDSEYHVQAGFFLLSEARSPISEKQLAASIRPILQAALTPEIGEFSRHLVMQTSQFIESVVVTAAKVHIYDKMIAAFSEYLNPEDRQHKIIEKLSNKTNREFLAANFDRQIGWLISAARVAQFDAERFKDLAIGGYEIHYKPTSIGILVESAWDLLSALSAMSGAKYYWDNEGLKSDTEVIVPPQLPTHLLYEAFRNMIRHSSELVKTAYLHLEEALDKKHKNQIVLSIHQETIIEDKDINQLESLKNKYPRGEVARMIVEEEKITGLRLLWFLSDLCNGDVELDNESWRDSIRESGVTRIFLPWLTNRVGTDGE
ncbi:hypothetical protein [Gimesia maris]|uniref:hypothetical protein n=1 Tax=Gimesia maris TaxID=122 RepID=UPI001E6534DF|nr:hypothetical protein [Gimesia maris]